MQWQKNRSRDLILCGMVSKDDRRWSMMANILGTFLWIRGPVSWFCGFLASFSWIGHPADRMIILTLIFLDSCMEVAYRNGSSLSFTFLWFFISNQNIFNWELHCGHLSFAKCKPATHNNKSSSKVSKVKTRTIVSILLVKCMKMLFFATRVYIVCVLYNARSVFRAVVRCSKDRTN